MTEPAVVIAGGGPTGLMLAGELALAGIDVVIVERRANQDLDGSRAGGLHSRTIEVLDQRGIAERFLSQGQLHPAHGFGGIVVRHQRLPDASQLRARALAEPFRARSWPTGSPSSGCRSSGAARWWASRRMSPASMSTCPTHVAPSGVSRRLRRGAQPRPQGRRHRLPRAGSLGQLDDRRGRDGRGAGARHPARGRPASDSVNREEGGGPSGSCSRSEHVDHTGDPTLDELREALVARLRDRLRGAQPHLDLPVHRHDAAGRRPTASGRVLLAGDAAHVHPPQGGQGMDTGVQDAVNLGWKLAQVVDGTSPESLLDTYHAERHPVAARVLQQHHGAGRAQQPRRPSPGAPRHHDRAAEHGRAAPAHRRDALWLSTSTTTSARDTRCSGGACPTSTCDTADGPDARLHPAARRPARAPRPREPGGFDVAPWAGRVRSIDADVRRRVGAPGPRRGRGARRRC